MSGKDGNRGYLVQSIIALLESLEKSDWIKVEIEADQISDKVDVAWHTPKGTRVSQIKSSINSFNMSDVKQWAEELEKSCNALEYTLVLIGPCSRGVSRLGAHNNVNVPTPKNIDIRGLIAEASHLVAKLLENYHIPSTSSLHRELIINGLITTISICASSGKTYTKSDFASLIKDWATKIAGINESIWELVDFSSQRGIEHAISGSRLGPPDVDSCPELSVCKEIKKDLDVQNIYWITGEKGCGKSITTWQVAKRYHDEGHIVLRPYHTAKENELLHPIRTDISTVLVIDDAQKYNREFLQRLSEKANEKTKIIISSTLMEFQHEQFKIISPLRANEEIKKDIIKNRKKYLSVVRKFDSTISDSYMDVALEDRLRDCVKQSSPWNFFWVLRGGWKTAIREFNDIKQFPYANRVLSLISFLQIINCDAGSSIEKIECLALKNNVEMEETKAAIEHLSKLGFIKGYKGNYKTKHISYASRVVEYCLGYSEKDNWIYYQKIILNLIKDERYPLQGVYWIIQSISFSDCIKENIKNFRPIMQSLKIRYKKTESDIDWAIGCYSTLIGIFGLSREELEEDESMIIDWLSNSVGRAGVFSAKIVNNLINSSLCDTHCIRPHDVESIVNKINHYNLTGKVNSMSIEDLYGFGSLMDRLTFFNVTWANDFISHVDWNRIRQMINCSSPKNAVGVDKAVFAMFRLSEQSSKKNKFEYISDINPFMLKCYNSDPINMINKFRNIFWICFGLRPHFLRNTKERDSEQIHESKMLVEKLEPSILAESMSNAVSRDLENIARSLSILTEVDNNFRSKISLALDHDTFNSSISDDWVNQSSELLNFIRFFCIGENGEPARSWIAQNEGKILGPLQPIIVAIYPEIAYDAFYGKKGLEILSYNRHWLDTLLCLESLKNHNLGLTRQVLSRNKEKLVEELYKLSLDEPRYIIRLFRIIYEISESEYLSLIRSIDLKKSTAIETLEMLNTTQRKEKDNYLKLAKLAIRMNNELSPLGEEIKKALEQPYPFS